MITTSLKTKIALTILLFFSLLTNNNSFATTSTNNDLQVTNELLPDREEKEEKEEDNTNDISTQDPALSGSIVALDILIQRIVGWRFHTQFSQAGSRHFGRHGNRCCFVNLIFENAIGDKRIEHVNNTNFAIRTYNHSLIRIRGEVVVPPNSYHLSIGDLKYPPSRDYDSNIITQAANQQINSNHLSRHESSCGNPVATFRIKPLLFHYFPNNQRYKMSFDVLSPNIAPKTVTINIPY